ncbi:hypothetical protein DL240_01345 [Lujinxingia litoralis]|uniref:Uncharacterized protein n=1 Tax=Lujinxingia litoralis TaxID=2211119 RepID=A0A328C9U2_9DELT|nr:hypothetical protein [Lujinxingia litoralis]RAL24882.1 hypothetical protein DL240_01345 [Lujinxingia litoralis]
MGLPAIAQQSATPTESTTDPATGFDLERIKVLRVERKLLLDQQREDQQALQKEMAAHVNHPSVIAGVMERRRHMERLAQLDRIKQIGDENNDQALIERAAAARDLELRRYFMWRTLQRTNNLEAARILPQTDTPGE